MNQEDLYKLKVPDLKAKCKELKLKTAGKKTELIERLLSSGRLRNSNVITALLVSQPLTPSEDQRSGLKMPLTHSNQETLSIDVLASAPSTPPNLVRSPTSQRSPSLFSTFHPAITEMNDPDISMNDILSSWLAKAMEKFKMKPISPSIFGHFVDDSPSSYELDLAYRFWINRFFYSIEFGIAEWINGQILEIKLLSADFAIVSEEQMINGSPSKIHHLVLFQTGQICSSNYSGAIPNEWIMLSGSIGLKASPYSELSKSIIKSMLSWDSTTFPNQISGNIPRNSLEFAIAVRFLLTHSEGLRGDSGELALKTRKNGTLFKLVLSTPPNIAVVSVHLSILGYPFQNGIAFIQTYGSEGLFVLAETGLSIGTEMEGICSTWMEILSCSSRGLPANAI